MDLLVNSMSNDKPFKISCIKSEQTLKAIKRNSFKKAQNSVML